MTTSSPTSLTERDIHLFHISLITDPSSSKSSAKPKPTKSAKPVPLPIHVDTSSDFQTASDTATTSAWTSSLSATGPSPEVDTRAMSAPNAKSKSVAKRPRVSTGQEGIEKSKRKKSLGTTISTPQNGETTQLSDTHASSSDVPLQPSLTAADNTPTSSSENNGSSSKPRPRISEIDMHRYHLSRLPHLPHSSHTPPTDPSPSMTIPQPTSKPKARKSLPSFPTNNPANPNTPPASLSSSFTKKSRKSRQQPPSSSVWQSTSSTNSAIELIPALTVEQISPRKRISLLPPEKELTPPPPSSDTLYSLARSSPPSFINGNGHGSEDSDSEDAVSDVIPSSPKSFSSSPPHIPNGTGSLSRKIQGSGRTPSKTPKKPRKSEVEGAKSGLQGKSGVLKKKGRKSVGEGTPSGGARGNGLGLDGMGSTPVMKRRKVPTWVTQTPVAS